MNFRENLQAFWSGSKPDLIPFSINHHLWQPAAGDPAWQSMFERGLGITWRLASFRVSMPEVEVSEERLIENGKPIRQQSMRIPEGGLSASWVTDSDGEEWPLKYWLETSRDYRLMQQIVERSQILPDYQAYSELESGLPDYAVALVDTGPSPIQKMLLDLAGLEMFAFHLADYPDEVQDLFDVLCDQFRQICEVVAAGPGRCVSVPESFSADALGPRRFRKYISTVYEECFPVIHAAGKIVNCYYDGATASCKQLIQDAPFDIIEALPLPPEGDLDPSQARSSWPEKLFWLDLNSAGILKSSGLIRQELVDVIRQASPDGSRLAFEIAEKLPPDWKDAIPLVMEVLVEISDQLK